MRPRLWALLLAACGGSPNAGIAPPDVVAADCDRSCEYDVACAGADADTCAAACIDHFDGWVREDALDQLASCRAALACELDPETCLAQVTPLALHERFEARCRERLAGCVGDLEPFCAVEYDPTGASGGLRFAATEVVEALIACMDGTDCAARLACEQDVLARYGIAN